MIGRIDTTIIKPINMGSLLAKAKKNKTLAPMKRIQKEKEFNQYIKKMMKLNGHINH